MADNNTMSSMLDSLEVLAESPDDGKIVLAFGDLPQKLDTWLTGAEGTLSEVDETLGDLTELRRDMAEAVEAAGDAKTDAETNASNAEAWAVGTRGGTDVSTEDETYHNNSKYYAEQTSTGVSAAAASASAAATSASAAAGSASDAASSANESAVSAAAASASATAASSSQTSAASSATAAAASQTAAASSATSASNSATSASSSATAASGSATAASGSASAAAQSAQDAQDVLDSIPPDYTAMTEDVSELKSAIKAITGNEQIPVETSGFIRLSSDPVSLTPESGSGYKCTSLECSAGDMFTISGSSYGAAARMWSFIDASYTRLELAESGASGNNLLLIAPANTKYLVVNNYNNTVTLYRGKLIQEALPEIEQLTKINITWTAGKRLYGDGIEVSGSGWFITNYIEIRNDIIFQIAYTLKNKVAFQSYAVYDENKTFLDNEFIGGSDFSVINGITNITDSRVKYIRFCSYDSYGLHSISIAHLNDFVVKDGGINGKCLTDQSVSLNKCEFAGHDPNTNFVDITKITLNCYIQTNGAPKTGQSGFAITDFIPVEAGMVLYSYHLMGGYCAFYKEDKTVLQGYDYGELSFPITVIENAKYVRFTTNTSWWPDTSEIWLYTKDEKPDPYGFGITATVAEPLNNPCDYDGTEISQFNKICCVGDSITAGTFNHNEGGTTQFYVNANYSYPTYLEKLYGVNTENWGIGGYSSVEWWNAKQSDDFSGFDCVIINLGINDAIQSVSVSDFTTAIGNIINAFKTANNGIKIFLATVVPAYADGVSTYDDINDAIRYIASNTADCYLVDLTEYSHVHKGTVYEAGHLSAIGYYKLARDYGGYIGYVIDNNMTDFKWIQFVGTNYSYD